MSIIISESRRIAETMPSGTVLQSTAGRGSLPLGLLCPKQLIHSFHVEKFII